MSQLKTEKDSIRKLCKKHLKEMIEETVSLEEKLHGGHLYYSKTEAECILKENSGCSAAVEDVEKNAGINYLVFVKGKLTNHEMVFDKLEKLVDEVSQLETTHQLRVGYETLLLACKQIRDVQTTHPDALALLKNNENRMVSVLNDKMANAHFVIRTLIKNIVKEVMKIEGMHILENPQWSMQNKTDITLSLKEVVLTVTENDVSLLNDKKCGDKITKLLLLSDHKKYAELIGRLDLNCVGSRNIRILSNRLGENIREEIFRILANSKMFNCVFFASASSTLPEFVIDSCSFLWSEEVRTEYLEVLLKNPNVFEERLPLIVQWLQFNQIIATKENQKRVRACFYTLSKMFRHKIVSKHAYLKSEGIEHAPTDAGMAFFREVISISLSMAESSNYHRQIQGLYYLKTLLEMSMVQNYVPERDYKPIILNALSGTHKEIREIAAQFPVEIDAEQIKNAVLSHRDANIYGMALLFTKNMTAEKISSVFSFSLKRIAAKDNSDMDIHKDIYLVWNIFNSLPAEKVLIDGNRLNPALLVEKKKRKAFGQTGLDIQSLYTAEIPYKIEEIYKEYILPQFKKSLEIMQTREIYLSEHTEIDESKSKNTQRTYVSNWYALRECIVFITVYAVLAKDITCLDMLIDALLSVGGHLGVIMTASDAIKTILVFNDSPENTVKYAQYLMKTIQTRDLKNIRRDGGIPYAFKALSAAESNTKDKPATHYIMKETVRNSFSLIEDLFSFGPIRANPSLTFCEYNSVSRLAVRVHNEPKIRNEKYLIHYMNILKGVSSDGVFKYDMRVYEPSLFLLSVLLISHSSWKVRNTSLMLYTTLIKKMCKETLNKQEDSKYSKVSVNPVSRQVMFSCLSYFGDKNDLDGVFSCLVFFSRVNEINEAEEKLLAGLKEKTMCARTHQKISQILHRKPSSNVHHVNSSHKSVSQKTKDVLSYVKTELFDKKEEKAEKTYRCPGLENSCMLIESEALNILGNEDSYIREYGLNYLMPNRSYEYVLRALLEKTKCASCLSSRIKTHCSLPTEDTTEDSQFPMEQSNLFRDIEYENKILRDTKLDQTVW
ncbi:hypothetical protein NEMIN01_0807 [Nematocida minor]|uniref:uncharacterized protein n=1 Tax=Nematocida minor TaxID=1912983 RepID=UPI00221F089C|nr:uncharacterized protein NEMIN01_0807 [Nematocida minor]KAI5190022.1 hypothetical protein NEMIN01_0807 [Nematocida minor]